LPCVGFLDAATRPIASWLRRKGIGGDQPDKATFMGKPFSAAMVHEHLLEKLPDGKKPEPLRKAV
jgi:hypothetical protein